MKEATLICTVYNEGESIEELLQSIEEQSVTPDEAVFVDGGSTDDTQERIKEFADDHEWMNLVVDEGCNIAEGRNIAVENASNDYIVSTDGGCVLHEEWYREMCAAFKKSDFVAGMWKPRYDSMFEEVQGKIIGHQMTVEELKKGNRGPSSRSIGFSVEAWEDAGGYPEELYTGEDSKFNAKILSSGYTQAVAEDALVYWKMRPTWKDLYSQFYTYGEGDAKGGNLFTHPSSKAGITKNFWLLSSAVLTIIAAVATIYLLRNNPSNAVYSGGVLSALITIPTLYYASALKQVLVENGLKAFLIGLAITQLKYWAWFDGFTLTCLKKPVLIPYQFKEAIRLK